ncbi:hypothetical protein BHE74_00009223, partial [Ensete ventricosum]
LRVLLGFVEVHLCMEGREGVVPSPAATAAVEGFGSYRPPLSPLTAGLVREEKPASEIGGMAPAAVAASASPAVVAAPPVAAPAGVVVGPAAALPEAAVVGLVAAEPMKKKRGRPRKYGPDGSLLRPLNPMPISASVPAGVQYTSAAAVGAAMKRGRGRPVGLVSKTLQYGLESEPLGIPHPCTACSFSSEITFAREMVACSAGANFTPHVINVAAGEVCLLAPSSAVLQGRFELLSLSGSFMPTENGGTRSRSGGLSVSLASPDGRVVGGGVAGLLVAASPVQVMGLCLEVVVGSFLPSYQMEQKIKKPRIETGSVSTPASAAMPHSSTDMEEAFGGGQGQNSSATGKPNPSTTSSFKVENWAPSLHPVPGSSNSTTDINIGLPGG